MRVEKKHSKFSASKKKRSISVDPLTCIFKCQSQHSTKFVSMYLMEFCILSINLIKSIIILSWGWNFECKLRFIIFMIFLCGNKQNFSNWTRMKKMKRIKTTTTKSFTYLLLLWLAILLYSSLGVSKTSETF